MTGASTTEALPRRGASAARFYTPSWIDFVTDAVRRLPVPAWLFYLGLMIGATLLYGAVKWNDGAYPVGTFPPPILLALITPIYSLALMHYLDNWAGAALDRFHPVMRIEEAEYEQLRYQFTTLPARPTLVATLIGAAYGPVNVFTFSAAEVQQYKVFNSPLASVLDVALFVLGFAFGPILIYHTIRQLRLVSRIYTAYTHTNLFQLRPWYALSELTARSALGIGVLAYTWGAINASGQGNISDLISSVLFSLIIVLAFIWPLLGAHRLLQQEKERLQGEASRRLEALLAEMDRRTDAGDFAAVAGMHDALESLIKRQSVLDKIPTWPWQPETVRGLVAALLLPVVIWFITYVLEHLIVF
jgi:hypothetical protein